MRCEQFAVNNVRLQRGWGTRIQIVISARKRNLQNSAFNDMAQQALFVWSILKLLHAKQEEK